MKYKCVFAIKYVANFSFLNSLAASCNEINFYILGMHIGLYLIFIHKLLNGKFDINTTEFDIQKTAGVTRGNGCNIVVKQPLASTIAKSFTHRIASQWNSLPLTAKKIASLNTIKTLIA